MRRAAGLARDHPRHLIAAAAAGGLSLGGASQLLVFVLGCLAVIALTALGLRAHVALGACALLILGAGLGAARLASIDRDPLADLPRGEVTLRGHLLAHPRSGQYGTTMRLRDEQSGQVLELRLRGKLKGDARIGAEVFARGYLKAVSPAASSSPEARRYAVFLLRSGVRRRLTASEAALTGGRRGGLAGVIDAMRIRAEDSLSVGLAAEPAALLRGMVLGGDAGLPEPTVEDFRASGLAHILAVSGQNVLLVVILAQAILTALGARRSWRMALPAVIVVLYVALCGAQASVIRAGAMGLAGLAALAASRPSSRVYALILAAIVVLAFNPRATADVGAQLSFAAVLGLMVFTRPLQARFTLLPPWAAQALAATLGATLATAPLMALNFGAVSVVSLVANVLGEPLIAPIVWLGSLTAALGQFSTQLGGLLNAPNSFLLGTLIELAHVTGGRSWAQVQTPTFGVAALLIASGAIVGLALVLNGWVRVPKVAVGGPGLAPVAALAAVVVAFAAFTAMRGDPPPPRPAIVMLDVGQGDATVLLGDGCAALIDGGPPGAQLARKLRAIGVNRLDAALVTHPESDHFGGLLEAVVSDEFPIATLLDGGGNTANPDYAQLRGLLTAQGTAFLPGVAGTNWSCPGISITLIGPPPAAPDAPPPENANTRAAVAQVSVGPLEMFASGDAESPQLLGLPLAPADVLKVSHHGSDDPGLAQLLERIRPRLALIGVGASNRYGHPTPSTLGALAAEHARTYRTDRDGMIVVTPGGVTTAGAGR